MDCHKTAAAGKESKLEEQTLEGLGYSLHSPDKILSSILCWKSTRQRALCETTDSLSGSWLLEPETEIRGHECLEGEEASVVWTCCLDSHSLTLDPALEEQGGGNFLDAEGKGKNLDLFSTITTMKTVVMKMREMHVGTMMMTSSVSSLCASSTSSLRMKCSASNFGTLAGIWRADLGASVMLMRSGHSNRENNHNSVLQQVLTVSPGWAERVRTCACVCVCVCVWERERDRERDRETHTHTHRTDAHTHTKIVSVHVCVQSMCVRE